MVAAGIFFSGCHPSTATETRETPVIASLYDTLGIAQPGEWRYEHTESDQTRDAFIAQHPQTLSGKIIYLQPIGAFDSLQQEMFELTGEWLHSVFQLTVKMLPAIAENSIDTNAWRVDQLRTGYIMDTLLQPELPDDAAGLMAITNFDIYPGDDWNFVFGEAGTHSKVGVSSFSRFGDPHAGSKEMLLFERRLLGTVLHEFLHMMGLEHCSYFSCVLNGSNSLEEADTKPILICPQCLEKMNYALQSDNSVYYRNAELFFNTYGFENESDFCEKAMRILLQPIS